MDISAYIYIQNSFETLYFDCAVKKVIAGVGSDLEIALEEGSTGDGNDMRSTPQCTICGKMFKDFSIA